MRKDLVDYKMDAREWEKAIDDYVIGKNEIMADATTEKEREIIRDAMSKLEKA